MQKQGEDPGRFETIELADFLKVIRERWWVITVSVVAVTAIAVGISLLMTPMYRASTQLLYKKSRLDTTVAGMTPVEVSTDKARELQTGAKLVRQRFLAEEVKKKLKTSRTPGELLSMVSAQPDARTDLITVTAVSAGPKEAADIANAFAEEYRDYRKTLDRAAIIEAKKVLEKERNALTKIPGGLVAKDPAKQKRVTELTNKIDDLAVLAAMQTGGYSIVQKATVPATPFSPKPVRNGILGLVVGLVLGTTAVFLLEYLDKRVKDEDQLQKSLGLPVLASVPILDGTQREQDHMRSAAPVGFLEPHSAILEAFRTLRSNLQYFELDRGLRKLLITSALPREGKTITTINLALSLALSGSRVVILEADLRRPMMHKYLDLGNEIGLSNVLAGTHTLTESMQLVQVDEFVSPDNRRGAKNGGEAALLQKNLYCVTSGPLPPNPAELLASAKMAEIIDRTTELADYVLIDSPPLLLVSDALTLSKNTDAVILAAWLYSTTTDEAKAVREILERATGVNAIGVVAGGVKPSKQYYTKYAYYSSSPSPSA